MKLLFIKSSFPLVLKNHGYVYPFPGLETDGESRSLVLPSVTEQSFATLTPGFVLHAFYVAFKKRSLKGIFINV